MSDTKELVPTTVNAEALISQAIEKELPIDTMERLLVMRRELKEEAAREEFFNALSNFQAACPEIPKTKIVMNKDGKTVRYKYAPLDTIIAAVKTPLKENGFSYTVKTEQDNGNVTAICRLHHIAGHTEETQLTVPIDKGSYMSAPQQIAAALTYAKRYAFCDATGIMTADEDNDAVPEEKLQKKPDNRKKYIDEIAAEIKKHNFPEGELSYYRDEIKHTNTADLPRLLDEIKKAGASLTELEEKGVGDAFDGKVEDAEFEEQKKELPFDNDKTQVGIPHEGDVF